LLDATRKTEEENEVVVIHGGESLEYASRGDVA